MVHPVRVPTLQSIRFTEKLVNDFLACGRVVPCPTKKLGGTTQMHAKACVAAPPLRARRRRRAAQSRKPPYRRRPPRRVQVADS